MGLLALGKLLGHASPSTTQRYAHLADDPLRRASELWFLNQPSETKPVPPGLSATAELPSGPTSSPAQPSGTPLTGDEVREVQGLLKTAGYDPGPVDGISGPQLEGATQRYLESRGVTVSKGKITQELLSRLRSDRLVGSTSGGWKLNGSQGLVRIVVIDKGQAKNQGVYRAAIEDICKSMPICQVLFWVEGTGAPKSLPMSDAQTGTQMANWNQNSNTGLRELLFSCKAFPATPKEKCF
jgi:peptidoglycan hydrolase-like protein with peptidoglycan-binding domain